MNNIRIGCSGWSYSDWLGPFYPKDTSQADFLKLYSKVFDVVEVDSSFYRLPSTSMVDSWKRSTSEGFIFTAKFPQKITHEARLKDTQDLTAAFLKIMGRLGNKLGPLLIQLPPSIKYDKHKDLLVNFLSSLDETKRYCVEFRHESWFNQETVKILQDRRIASCWSINQYLSTQPVVTADFVYLRMVGDRSITRFDRVQRDQTELMLEWYNNLKEKSDLFKEGFVFFNNHFAGFGPGSVNEFRRLASMLELDWTKLGDPVAKPQKSLMDFG